MTATPTTTPTTQPPVSVRAAVEADLPTIATIYASYVRGSLVTFETEPPDARAWRERFDGVVSRGLPFLVAEVTNSRSSAGEARVAPGGGASVAGSVTAVVGYAYAGPWKERAAYRYTVENAIYLAPEAVGRGIGELLLRSLLAACTGAGAHEVIAVIADSGDPASVRLHARCGFREVGRLERVGLKFGRWVDTVLMQCSLSPAQVGGAAAG